VRNKKSRRHHCFRTKDKFNGKSNGKLTLYAICSLALILLCACGKRNTTFTAEERHEADSIVRSVKNIDSLAMHQKQWEKDGKTLLSIIALREQGKSMRNNSLFDKALYAHSKGLTQAKAACDTIEWVQALNNVGTDYRRCGE
jgi:hypothetical protein